MTTNMVVNNVMSMDARKIEHTLKSFDTASFDMAVEDIMGCRKRVYNWSEVMRTTSRILWILS